MNKIGFGFLRLPQIDKESQEIDWELLNKMTDEFLLSGGTYFDTAYTYLDGKSEEAIRRSVVQRHPRDRFQIADKLPSWQVTSSEDCYRYFDQQLERCGVDYFDVYLLHWLNGENYRIAEEHHEFDFLIKMKAIGKAKRIGFSYHDGPVLLDEILSAHPEVDVVQLQINYLDWESVGIEARKCYETAVKHGKSVIVMEPVKGGTLAKLPDEAERLFKNFDPDSSVASWALRFAQSLEHVEIVLSGMNTEAQIKENMQDTEPFSHKEYEIAEAAAEIISGSTAVACTKCHYCDDHCPENIAIPEYFELYNECKRYPDEDWKIEPAYHALTETHGKASECIGCRQCEKNCPQSLEISSLLKQVAELFEQNS